MVTPGATILLALPALAGAQPGTPVERWTGKRILLIGPTPTRFTVRDGQTIEGFLYSEGFPDSMGR